MYKETFATGHAQTDGTPYAIWRPLDAHKTETTRYLLDMPPRETRHMAEQVKGYLNAMQNPRIHSTMLSKNKMAVDWQEASHGWAKQNILLNMCATSHSSSE